jgi:D-alanyl-lipoteichoic acid acyltransferase DltB (MBOAT superfamily)
MLFNSYIFIFVFLPITWLGFQWLRSAGGNEPALFWLVLASLVFYGYWEPVYLVLMISSIVANYGIGQWLGRFEHGSRESRSILTLGVAANLAALAYFKYANFFVNNVNALWGSSLQLDTIVLPLAISFFTFQQITYLVDTARGLTSEHRFSHYCLYVTFFPQLIAGPIVHHKEMLPQFVRQRWSGIQYSDIAVGMSIFALGLFKKVIVADNLSPFVGEAFGAAHAGAVLSFSDAWIGALAYTFQLYFDFSGYADMAIGLARLFSIRLPLNFNSPYKSTSIIDFWRRWHMTLSRFLRDYLYIPLGGNRKGELRRYINLLATMLLGGLWHGAGWTFLFWGAMHGSYLVLNHLWVSFGKSSDSPLARIASRLLTFVAVVYAWAMFRAVDLASAMAVMSAMSGLTGEATISLFKPAVAAPMLILLLIWVWVMPNTQELMQRYRPAFGFQPRELAAGRWQVAIAWRPSARWCTALGLVLLVSLLNLSELSEFIYFQF